MVNKESKELLIRYSEAKCSPEEIALMESWYNHMAAVKEGEEVDYERILSIKEKVWNKLNREKRTYNIYKVAATVLLFILFGNLFYVIYPGRFSEDKMEFAILTDKAPAGNSAILTLDNGQRIDLSENSNDTVFIQPGVIISKSGEGGLVYRLNNAADDSKVAATNTLTVPRGGKYRIILPDGSKVYLNAGSSLIYPTRFTDTKRSIALAGEGYFEIARNALKPFEVHSAGQTVKVVGTRFNISGYSNEPTRTTLLAGKVDIAASLSGKYLRLNPGQQAILTSKGLGIHDVNATDAIGWTNNLFIFTQTPIQDALAEISRWYRVEIDYRGLPDNIKLVGECNRESMLSEVLAGINAMNKINLIVERDTIKMR